MVKLDKAIFREYDIRGRVPEQLDEKKVALLAKGFAAFFLHNKIKEVAVSCDNRLSSPKFKEIICNELSSAGLNVIDFGLTSTGMHYFALFKHDLNAGIMITASHLSKEHNGFKISLNKTTIYGAQIQLIRELIEEKDFVWLETEHSVRKGIIKQQSILQDYFNAIKENIKLNKKLKVAIDCANGTSSLLAKELFEALGCNVLPLYCNSDGSYPNHEADPTKEENLADLIDLVLKEKADLGISFDGDADRLGVIDDKGNIIFGDILLALFSKDILKRRPNSKIIFEVKCSNALIEEIKKNNGIPLMWKTGHSLIKKKLLEENAVLAGEMSGHFFFNDKWFGFDDGIYAAARLLELLSNSNQKLSKLTEKIPHYFSTPEIHLNVREEEKFELIEKLKKELLKEYDAITIDGIRVIFPDGWALIRASNTSSKLVLRFEANSKEHLQRIKEIITEKLLEIKPSFRIEF